jgi:hypothetical protein
LWTTYNLSIEVTGSALSSIPDLYRTFSGM